MSEPIVRVADAAHLEAALDRRVAAIGIEGAIDGLKSIRLPSGCSLRGTAPGAELRFEAGQPGILLSADSLVVDLRLVTDEAQVAVGLADDVDDLGTLWVKDVRTVGRVNLEGGQAMRGEIRLERIHVERGDARMAANRPSGYGVEALIGVIAVHNTSRDAGSRWMLEAVDLSAGDAKHPVRGGGVFVFGGATIPLDADMATAPAPTREGGGIEVVSLSTGEIHVDGGIPAGTGNLIAAGVFIGSGVHAREVVNDGPTTTYGSADMVLDNWGKVDVWTARADITSHGASGIGFVNFGDLDSLWVDAPIETHGVGARGFNLYDGSLRAARFRRIVTHGDGAIGVQLSKPFGSIEIDGDVRTKGGEGDSLVRGKVVRLKAHAFSIKPGTSGDSVTIGGGVVAEDPAIEDWDFEAPASTIARIRVGGHALQPDDGNAIRADHHEGE